jgi:hypothetical protein
MIMLSLHLIKHHNMKTCGGLELYIHTFLTSALDGGEGSALNLGRYTSEENQISSWFED